MGVTDRVRTGKCNLEFLSKVLKFKVNIGKHDFLVNRLKRSWPQDIVVLND